MYIHISANIYTCLNIIYVNIQPGRVAHLVFWRMLSSVLFCHRCIHPHIAFYKIGVVASMVFLKLTFLPSDRLLPSFLFCWYDKIPWEKQCKGQRVYLGIRFQRGAVHHGREGIATGRKDVLLCFSALWSKSRTKATWGEKGLFPLTLPGHRPSLKVVRARAQGRNHGGRLLTGLLSGSCLACFLIHRPTCLRMTSSTMSLAPHSSISSQNNSS